MVYINQTKHERYISDDSLILPHPPTPLLPLPHAHNMFIETTSVCNNPPDYIFEF